VATLALADWCAHAPLSPAELGEKYWGRA
jgi:hypothetical protein